MQETIINDTIELRLVHPSEEYAGDYIIKEDNQYQGCLSMILEDNQVIIDDILIDNQGKGTGTKVLYALKDYALKNNIKKIELRNVTEKYQGSELTKKDRLAMYANGAKKIKAGYTESIDKDGKTIVTYSL